MIRYMQGDSILHRFHPVPKLAVLFAFCISLFIADSLVQMSLLLGLLFISLISSKTRIKAFGGKRFFIMFSGSLILINMLFARSGEVIASFLFIKITVEGIVLGVMKASLFIGIVLSSLLYVATTDTGILTQGLMQAGIPYRYGYMLIMSMRMAPVFEMESSTVRNAQIARGLQLDVGGLSKIKNLARYTFVPLIVSALSKVDALTVSMEGRAFGIYRKRTFLRSSHMNFKDVALSCVAIIYMIISLTIAP